MIMLSQKSIPSLQQQPPHARLHPQLGIFTMQEFDVSRHASSLGALGCRVEEFRRQSESCRILFR